ncbi:MAG: mandelate racemase/muconate lactonizing enzyme family protein [Chloroflexota bacterium]|jgi:L-alanine-DL-glutamate epimerase-like enolase superfamily enzyme
MKIEQVDFFYLSMPEVRDIGDGSQDALLVRVRGGGYTGWGECEASPLVSIAGWCCPMSHSACKPVKASVLGQTLNEPTDIERINRLVREQSLDLAQADHTLSGIDIALWDLLGKRRGEPVYALLGNDRAHPKLPYASQLFGNTPEETYTKAKRAIEQGYHAVKFGRGPYGRGNAAVDAAHIAAAREGLGDETILLVDAGTVWDDDVALARQRLSALREHRVHWLEEPFVGGAVHAYGQLAPEAAPVALAGGEGARHFHDARHLIDYGRVGYIQIDAGRIGGITTARRVARYAASRGVRYVNHTFTTHLALSASLQPYADLADHELCEYPVEQSELARTLTHQSLARDADGRIRLPDCPGLGLEPDPAVIRKYPVHTQITVAGRVVYTTPDPDEL